MTPTKSDLPQGALDLLILKVIALWRRGFANDPDIVGKSFRLDGASFTVVGVRIIASSR